jgi:Ca-activated chloride channel homolog
MLKQTWIALALIAVTVACANQGPWQGESASEPTRAGDASPREHPGGFRELDRTAPEEWVVIERDGLVRNAQGELAGGQLQARRDGQTLVPMPLSHTEVRGDITLQIASVEVVQQYENPFDEKIEAVYVFPLPDDAAITDFMMEFGGRKIRGVIREKEAAREVYERAKSAGHVATLMTQSRPNLFTQSVANIEPGERVDVRVTYFHSMRHDDGVFELRVPLVVGPRFNPTGSTDPVGALARGKGIADGADVTYLAPSEVSSQRVSLAFDIDAGVPLGTIESRSHRIVTQRDGESRARVSLAAGDRYPNRDFVLRYSVARDAVHGAVALHRGTAGDYFALFLQPPSDQGQGERVPVEMVFVVDTSSSMAGDSIAACRQFIHRSLDRLGERDRFQIINFSADVGALGRRSAQATALNLEAGREFVDALEARGGTVMRGGLEAALATNSYGDHRTIIVFMTDGYIGNEAEVLGMIDAGIGDARIFSFGVGSAPNTYLLERMAELGRGASAYLDAPGTDARVVDELFSRLERPILTDLEIEWGGAVVTEVYPSRLPDLVPGRPVMIVGRTRGGANQPIRLTANDGTRRVEQLLSFADGLDHSAIEKLWARAKIREFSDRVVYTRDVAGAERTARETALDHGLLSAYTAFVAVDGSGRTLSDHGTTVRVAVPVPAGVRYDTTVTR